MTTIPLGSVAAAMAGAGMHVFPVLAGQKRPATRTGLKAATRDPATINRWWTANPLFNIGVACQPSGLVVIDCDAGKPWPLPGDPPAGVGDGADVLQALAERHGQPDLLHGPGAVTVATPSGGLHVYYRQGAAPAVKSSAGKVAPWIDVRAAGGYVVAPFSATPAGHYRPVLGWDTVVITDAGVDFQPIGVPSMDRLRFDPPPLPEWLYDVLVPPAPPEPDMFDRLLRALDGPAVGNHTAWAAAALQRECQAVAAAVEGTRNDTLNRAAFSLGQIAGAGVLTEAEVSSALLSSALASGLDRGEALTCIGSGMRAGAASPRDVTGLDRGVRSVSSVRNDGQTTTETDTSYGSYTTSGPHSGVAS